MEHETHTLRGGLEWSPAHSHKVSEVGSIPAPATLLSRSSAVERYPVKVDVRGSSPRGTAFLLRKEFLTVTPKSSRHFRVWCKGRMARLGRGGRGSIPRTLTMLV